MERAIAVKQLRRLLGPKFGYQVDSNAPGPDAREEAKQQYRGAAERKQKASDAVKARREQLLTDPEYQRLLAEWKEADEECNKISWNAHHRYKFTVGTSNSLFFTVAARGDSWEEVIAKVKGKNKVPATG